MLTNGETTGRLTKRGFELLAYLAAQFCDVRLFHFWKKLTRGRHLWLRNNGSTLVSQLIDTVAVILIMSLELTLALKLFYVPTSSVILQRLLHVKQMI